MDRATPLRTGFPRRGCSGLQSPWAGICVASCRIGWSNDPPRRTDVNVLLLACARDVVEIGGQKHLVAPHIARRILGVDWRVSMPGALLIGPTLLLTADVIAQRLIPGMELPVGVITALLGAPFLLVLLRKDANA